MSRRSCSRATVPSFGDDPIQGGNSRLWITASVDASLRRLQADYIDLYPIHRPDPDTDIEETLAVLSDLIRAGKVRAIGSSAMPASDMVEAQWVAERRGLERFRCEQPTYSILNRGIEAEVLPVAQRYGMGILVWSPLAQGLLTGRARRGQQSDLRRAALFEHLSDERRLDAVEELIVLADDAGLQLRRVALAFAIAHPAVSSAIIGPRTVDHLEDLIAGADVTLPMTSSIGSTTSLLQAPTSAPSTWPTAPGATRAGVAPSARKTIHGGVSAFAHRSGVKEN